jgi:hypothetical protein
MLQRVILTGRGRTWPLNRILEAAKMRRELVGAFSEEKKVKWGAVFGRLYKIEGDAALKQVPLQPGAARALRAAVWERRRKQPPKSAVFCPLRNFNFLEF